MKRPKPKFAWFALEDARDPSKGFLTFQLPMVGAHLPSFAKIEGRLILSRKTVITHCHLVVHTMRDTGGTEILCTQCGWRVKFPSRIRTIGGLAQRLRQMVEELKIETWSRIVARLDPR